MNCCRMFAELRKALAGGIRRVLDKAKDYIASSAPGHRHLRHPGLIIQFLFEACDLETEVTPKASSTCDEAEGAQRRPSTKRALFSDQYSELEEEITSLIASDIPSRQKPEDVFSFDKQAFEAQFIFSLSIV